MSAALLDYHRRMVTDPVRMGAWQKAIAQAVKPGDVVVDIGAGTGVLSLLACAAGARRIFAIEESPIIEVARELTRQGGFGERVTFLSDSSIDIRLPELAHVVLGDVFGAFGLNGDILTTMIDARKRFLRPGGQLLPRGTELFCAPVEMPEFYARTIDGWTDGSNGNYGGCRARAVNQMHLCEIPPEAALAAPASLGAVDLLQATRSDWKGKAEFEVSRAGCLHGIGGWCDARLTAEITASNSPFATARLDWSQALFPVEQAVPVRPGDVVGVSFELATHGAWMVWNWSVAVKREGAPPRHFRQSTFKGRLLDLNQIRRQRPDAAPTISEKGEVVKAVLELCDGSRSNGQICDEILRRFPAHFTSPSQASRLVGRAILSLCK